MRQKAVDVVALQAVLSMAAFLCTKHELQKCDFIGSYCLSSYAAPGMVGKEA